MILVAEDELQGVLARRQRHLGFGLAGAEMQVIEVVRQRPVERRRRHVDDQVVVAGILPVEPGRGDAHVAQAEMDGRLGGQRRAILDIDEMDRGARRRGIPLSVPARQSTTGHGPSAGI